MRGPQSIGEHFGHLGEISLTRDNGAACPFSAFAALLMVVVIDAMSLWD